MLGKEPRKAVETVVATESGISIPDGASKCTQPSPSDGCNPRTRATSYAIPATLELCTISETVTVAGARIRPRRPEPGHPASNTSPVGLWFGTLIALFLLIAPGAIIARIAQLTWPIAIAVGPALTYGVVALAIIPFGAIGIPWNGWTALATLAVVCVVMIGVQPLLARYRDSEAEARGIDRRQALTVAAGVLLGALLIMWAAYRGVVHWQSIPSTWDAVWHANTVRFILDTGQASSTHMGELRNVETHQPLYYPSVFHALTAVYCQLTGAAPTTGYTLSSVAAAVWLFPIQRGDADLAPAPSPHDARRRSGRDGRGVVGVVHVGALRRVRHRGDAQPGGLRRRDPDVPSGHLDAAASRSHPAGGAGPGRCLLGASVRRVHRDPVRRSLVASGGVLASGARADGRRADAGRVGGAGRADPGAAVLRGGPAGGHHRRARLPQLQDRQAGRHRRSAAAHPPSQRLPDAIRPGRAERHRHGDPAVQADLVAAGALAGAHRGDHLFGGAVPQSARHRHRTVQPVLLQRSATAVGGGDHAGDADGGRRGLRVGRRRRRSCQTVHSNCLRPCGSRPPCCCWR